jgi:hypothetical protein
VILLTQFLAGAWSRFDMVMIPHDDVGEPHPGGETDQKPRSRPSTTEGVSYDVFPEQSARRRAWFIIADTMSRPRFIDYR